VDKEKQAQEEQGEKDAIDHQLEEEKNLETQQGEKTLEEREGQQDNETTTMRGEIANDDIEVNESDAFGSEEGLPGLEEVDAIQDYQTKKENRDCCQCIIC